MPLLSTRIFSDLPLTVTVAIETVFAPADPVDAGAFVVGATVGASVGGEVGGEVVELPDLELLEQAASAIAASTAAAAILKVDERIGTSLSRVPEDSIRDEPRSGSRELPQTVVRTLRV